jgi:hypothetical protein
MDVVVGFETRNYSPPMPVRVDPPHQRLYLGVALDMQQVLSALFCDCLGRRIGRGIFEVASVPYTTLPVVSSARSQGGTP